MANAWKRDKAPKLLSPISLFFLFSFCILIIFFFLFGNSNPSEQSTPSFTIKPDFPFRSISPFDCFKCPQSFPVIANVVEGVRYPFLFSIADLGNLPDKPHKNIVRMLKGKPFRKPDISVTIQEVLEKMKSDSRDGYVVDVGANVGMASFAAAAMGFRVLAFEPVFENLQRICDGIYLNRVGELVNVFEAAASDRLGNITVHKASDGADSNQTRKNKSILCSDCNGNGAVLCSQCKGTGVNSVDHFNGQFKAGSTCWLCRYGKKDILCGGCNGAGFMGGFMSTADS